MTEPAPHQLLLLDAVDRIDQVVTSVLDGLSPGHLTFRPDPDANTIAWLLWHLARVTDDHLAGLAGREQVWLADGWVDRFALPFDRGAIGYGQDATEVGQVQVPADALAGYQHAVHAFARDVVGALSAEDLERVVDERWDPPVTAAVRVVSVLSDALQHAGQAAYVRGLAERAG